VRIFRRRETLNERLLRESGLDAAPVPPQDGPLLPQAAFPLPAGIRAAYEGPQRPREWEAVATVRVPDLLGDAAAFVALPDGSLLVEDEQGDAGLGPLADAVEAELRPPYRARAVRREGELWAVAANRIEVVQLRAEGDELELASLAGSVQLIVDGMPTTRRLRPLEQLGEREGADYAVRASRLDGDLWEVTASPL
jgi:hypothetical protein